MKDPNWKPGTSDLPPIILPSGLSPERQQYLFETFCREDTKDLVCPDTQLPIPPPPLRDPPSDVSKEKMEVIDPHTCTAAT